MLKKIIDFLVDNLGIKPDVAASIILTLLTFSFGFIITWSAASISKWRKRRNYRKSLKIIIRNFLESCKKQYLLLEGFTNYKGFLHGEDYKISIKSNFTQNYLTNLDISVFIENFSSIFKKNRPDEISDLFEIVETVKTSKESLKEQLSLYYSFYDENLKKYNDNLDGLRKTQDDFILEFHNRSIESQLEAYILSVMDTFRLWRENGASTKIMVTNNEIVTPLFNAAVTYPPNRISRKILDNCLQCRMAVENITNVENNMIEAINEVRIISKNSYEKGLLILGRW